MKISIKYKPKCEERPWLVAVDGGEYSQHAHMHTKEDALKVRELIDAGRYPYCKEYKVAMMRLLGEEKFKTLKKKDRYINSQKGLRK